MFFVLILLNGQTGEYKTQINENSLKLCKQIMKQCINNSSSIENIIHPLQQMYDD